MHFDDLNFNKVLSVSSCYGPHSYLPIGLNDSICFHFFIHCFIDDLTQNLPQCCIICPWKHPNGLSPVLAAKFTEVMPVVILHTHHGAEVPGGWAPRECNYNIPFELFLQNRMPLLLSKMSDAPLWICRGMTMLSCIFYSCKAISSEGT